MINQCHRGRVGTTTARRFGGNTKHAMLHGYEPGESENGPLEILLQVATEFVRDTVLGPKINGTTLCPI